MMKLFWTSAFPNLQRLRRRTDFLFSFFLGFFFFFEFYSFEGCLEKLTACLPLYRLYQSNTILHIYYILNLRLYLKASSWEILYDYFVIAGGESEYEGNCITE